LNFTRGILNRIFIGIEHLNYKNEDDLAIELIAPLDMVLNEWFDNGEEYLIVISYNNSLNNFYVSALPEEVRELVELECQQLFNSPFKQLLIQISKPKLLIDDFLGSVPVYHELGHFVDFNYQITKSIYDDKSGYKPLLSDDERSMELNHLREHFADIFAAQYIGLSSNEMLNYIAYKAKKVFTHPSTDTRISVVKAFVTGTGSSEHFEIVHKLIEQTKKRTNGRILIDRCKFPAISPFELNRPVKMENKEELHSLFSLGWNDLICGDYVEEDKGDSSLRCKRINYFIKESIRLTIQSN